MLKRYPLSYIQKLFLSEQLYEIDSTHLNIGGCLVVEGRMNQHIFEKAVHAVCKENEILRTIFVRNNEGEYFQEVQESLPVVIFNDFSSKDNPDECCKEWFRRRISTPFDIQGGKMYEIGLLFAGNRSYSYSVYNHLVADGWSITLTAHKIAESYDFFDKGIEPLSKSNISFFDFLEDEKEYIHSSRYNIDRQYWIDKVKTLEGYACSLSNNRHEKYVVNSRSREFKISFSDYSKMLVFCEEKKTTPFHFFILILFLITKARTGNNKVLINVRSRNRSGIRKKCSIGSFANVLPVTADLSSNDLSSIFEQVSLELSDAYKHQQCSWKEFYQNALVKGIDLSGAINFSFEPHDHNYLMGGFPTESFTVANGKVINALNVQVRDFYKQNSVFVDMYFDEKMFSDLEADIVVEQFRLFFYQLLNSSNIQLPHFKTLTLIEENIQKKMNDTDEILSKDNLCSVLEDVFYKYSSLISVVCRGQSYSYQELMKKAYSVAGFLHSLGINNGDRVSVVMDYSFEMIVAMSGIILSGAVFLPISNKDPLERIGKIVSDSKSRVIITDNRLDLVCDQVLIKDILDNQNQIVKRTVFLADNSPCYIVYTSGSTGEPKGVINTHKAVVNVLDEWLERYKIVGERFVLLQTSSFAHDVFIGNFLKTIATGGTLILPTDKERHDLNQLSQLFLVNKVNTLDSTPSLIVMLLNYMERMEVDDSYLKLIVLGSDICSLEDFKRLFVKYRSRATVINSYGVSEAAIYSMDYTVSTEKELPLFGNLPIGKPFRNTKMYVLNSEFKSVPVGSEGELFIAGYGLAEGYTSAELTNEKFIEIKDLGRVYRTGDLVRVLADGNIQFIGRIDFQIKIRGYRIEPGEIEFCMERFKGITKAVVVVPEILGNNSLIAYYTCIEEIHLNELVVTLRRSLPEYMVPHIFKRLESIPLSLNGKVDRKKLMLMEIHLPEGISPKFGIREDKKCVQEVWQRILGQRFYQTKGFLQMGGDSLEAIRIASEMNNFGYNCSYLDIYECSSFEEFCNSFEGEEKISDIAQANSLLRKVFGEEIQLYSYHHTGLQKKIIELKISSTKQFLDTVRIIEFCKERFSQSIQPHYFFGKDYDVIGDAEAKALLSEFYIAEKSLLNICTGKESLYRLEDPLYFRDIRNYYRNVYFVSKIRIDGDINDTRLAVKELMNKNDLLRSRLVKISLEKYAWEVFEEMDDEIPFLDLSEYEPFSSYDFIYNVMSVYYAARNDYRKYMFRAVIVKLNLSETYLWYFMDDSIHDDYGNQLINRYLSLSDSNGYSQYPKTGSYKDYLGKFLGGLADVDEAEIIRELMLDDFKKQTDIYCDYINKLVGKQKSRETFCHTFRVSNTETDQFSLALEVFIVFAKQQFPFTKVPIVLLHNTRFFSSEEFANSIGAYIDEVPLIVDTSLLVEDNLRNIRFKLEYINNNGIHFKNILLNPLMKYKRLRQKVRKIVGNLKETKRLLLFNFKQGDIHIDELFSEDGSGINRWLYGISFSIKIVDGICEVLIKFPYSTDTSNLKSILDLKYAGITGQE